LGYNCYQKFENRNPYICLTRYLFIKKIGGEKEKNE